MNNQLNQQPTQPVRGYLEGYYGKLLSWSDRHELLDFLSSAGLSAYCYAPKEDPQHRLHWREPYSAQWRQSFSQFCQKANDLAVCTSAGIAPGLDYHFAQNSTDSDFHRLKHKAEQFLADGVKDILVLWDDIDEECYTDRNGLSEGTAHARVVNQLADTIGQALWTVPRVYAAEIENRNNYLQDFFTELESPHTVLLCGNAIVASSVKTSDLSRLSQIRNDDSTRTKTSRSDVKHRTIVWDNFYANDYCPRRLFLGPWTGRDQINDYLLNPTGLPHTDKLLLDIASSTHTSPTRVDDWQRALKRHNVPEVFLSIAPYFSHPFFGDKPVLENHYDIDGYDLLEQSETVAQAIEECLWKWKSPLAREWYPYIMSLKHDLAITQSALPRNRILKTQHPALAKKLLS